MAESESESPALPLRLWQYPTAAIDPRQMISSGASAQEKLGQKGQWPLGHCITPQHNRHSLLIEFIEVLILRAVLAVLLVHARRHFRVRHGISRRGAFEIRPANFESVWYAT